MSNMLYLFKYSNLSVHLKPYAVLISKTHIIIIVRKPFTFSINVHAQITFIKSLSHAKCFYQIPLFKSHIICLMNAHFIPHNTYNSRDHITNDRLTLTYPTHPHNQAYTFHSTCTMSNIHFPFHIHIYISFIHIS